MKTVSLLFVCVLTLLSVTDIQSLSTPNKSSSKSIKLYTYPSCPHCHSVTNFLKKKGWHDRVVIINADDEQNYQELKKLRNDGKDYCPYLSDEVNNIKMGESKKIIEYFKEIFSETDNAL